MTGLRIDRNQCVGCGICAKTCAFGALEIKEKKAEANDNCALCGMCVDVCPFQAISIEKEEQQADRTYRDVWVFAELTGDRLAPVVRELLGAGRRLADQKGCRLAAALIGGGNAFREAELISLGADVVYFCRDEKLADKREEPYTAVLKQMVERYRPEIFLFGATAFGRSLAPRLAARLQTGLTADCTGLSVEEENGLLRQTRPAFGGNLMATILCPARRPQMATVRPGVMPPAQADTGRSGIVREVPLPEFPERIKVIKRVPLPPAKSIADAEILVVAGRGIGSRKNLSLVTEFASLIGAEYGCSRPLVDGGWCEYPHQVGQTGCSVAPKLLISLGVSGAIQHLAGISRAETIVAVNTDPHAPIFSVSRYAVVGDCVEILKEWIRMLKCR